MAASTFRARYSAGPSHTTLVDATPAPDAAFGDDDLVLFAGLVPGMRLPPPGGLPWY